MPHTALDTLTEAIRSALPRERDGAGLKYEFYGRGEGARFTRHLERGWLRPGPTTILNVWDKNLGQWYGEQEREKGIVEVSSVAGRKWDELRKTTAVDELGGVPFAACVEAAARVHLGKMPLAGNQRKRDAGDIGTQAHERIKWELQLRMGQATGPEPECGDEAMIAVRAWQKYWNDAGIVPIAVEQPIWSDRMETCGTIDFIGWKDGKLGVADTKSSKYVGDAAHLQTNHYCDALNERLWNEIEGHGGSWDPAFHEVSWAEIWHVPKVKGQAFRAIPLGECVHWLGNGKTQEKKRTRAELSASFAGIQTAWNYLVRHPEAR